MVEVIITMFVLAIGLLGVASLQFVGSFTNAEALNRTHAEMVAQQTAERLRVAAFMDAMGDGMVLDNEYFDATNYNFSGMSCTSGNPFACHCNNRPAAVPNCEGGDCNQAQMAVFDAWTLSCSAVQSNSQTRISLSCDDNDETDVFACSAGSFIEIQLRWPLRTQKQTEMQSDDRCEQEDGQSYSCVTKIIAL